MTQNKETQKERWIRKSAEIARNRQTVCQEAAKRYNKERQKKLAASENCAAAEARHIADLIERQLENDTE